MRRLNETVIALLTALTLYLAPAWAGAAEVRMVPVNPTASLGELVTLTVQVDSAADLAGFQFDFTMVPASLELKKVTIAPAFEHLVLNSFNGVSGQGRVAAYSSTPHSGTSLTLATVECTVKGSGSSAVTLANQLLGESGGDEISSTAFGTTISTALNSQGLSFAPLPAKVYGNASFNLSATGGASGNPITFTSSDPAVATVSSATVTITGAGSCIITARQEGNASYATATAQQTLTVSKAPLIVSADNQQRSYSSADPAFSVNYSGFVLNEGRAVLSGAPAVSTTATLSSNAGSYPITPALGTLASNNYDFRFVAGTLTVNKAVASVTIDSSTLAASYDGSAKAISASTLPAGKSITISYNNSPTAPTNAGSYPVLASISDPNYQGSASGTLVIARASATVTLENLSQTYDGSAKSAGATTTPAGKAVSFSYDGSGTAPTNAGSYAVIANISDANFLGSAQGTLTIGKASASVTLGNLNQSYDGSAKSASATTLPAGKTVLFSYDGSSSAPSNAGSYAVVATISDANYQGSASGTLVIGGAAADNTAPLVISFTIPGSSTSLLVPISSLSATDAVGVTGYLLSESGSQPQATDAAWSASGPAWYSFGSQGAKILYAFAKDAAGNISVPLSASVVVTLADTVAPTVTSFTLPATAASLTVPVTALTASDANGVTGYLISETPTQPESSDPGWATSQPTQYLFSSQGAKTLYAFARDAAGNVSAPLEARVTITLTDNSAPVISEFTLPANATALTVTVSTLVAADNVAVTSYLLSESGSQPQANDPAWSADKPTSFTFLSQGAKTLYAYAKDSAGNVSAPLAAQLTVTLADSTAPAVSFSIPATATSLTVPVSSFSASDAVGVTGYYLGEAPAAPLQNDPHWAGQPITSYTFAFAGVKTLYAFAKDAAGNVSVAVPGTVTVTLADSTAPTVNVFLMPAGASSLTVAVTSLSASDATAVTGYLLSESASAPAAGSAGWSSTPPVSYTFSAAGSVTLYAYAKDAAGNVSAGLAATTVITLADTAPPTVTNFSIPATSNSLIVPITTFTATDNVAVTGYLLSQSSSATATVPGWLANSPVFYTFGAAGNQTLYAFAKDAAGLVSTPVSASVLITLPAIPGVCGSSSGGSFSSIPDAGLCSTGAATDVTGSGPWNWSCGGINGGASANCSANLQTWTVSVVSGGNGTVICNSPVNAGLSSFCTVTPASGYQLASFTDDGSDKMAAVTSGGYSITKVSANHIITVTFSLIPPAAVNGSCGTSNNGTFTAVPTANLCATGKASPVSGSGSGPWSWSCSGSDGGSTASCAANLAVLPRFSVTPATGVGFTMLPATAQDVASGSTASFTVTASAGYGIASVSGCGGSLNGSSYTTAVVTGNCTLSVTAIARDARGDSTAQPTLVDALKVFQSYVGSGSLSPAEKIRYDVAPLSANGSPLGNGVIDDADIILILRRSIGIGSW
jgi:hypothetical protein